MLNGRAWGNSIWTDFKDRWNGNTYLGSYSTGSFMSDWTLTGTSLTSQVSAVSGSISGQAYAHIASQSTGVQHTISWAEPPSVSNCDIIVGGRVLTNPSAPTDGFGILARDVAGGEFRSMLSGSSATPRNEIQLSSVNSVTSTVNSTDYAFSWSLNTWYWMRLNASGGTFRLKAWARGSTEPASWDIVWSPPFAQTAAGRTGVALGGAIVSSQQIDFFSFCSDGNPAWGPL